MTNEYLFPISGDFGRTKRSKSHLTRCADRKREKDRPNGCDTSACVSVSEWVKIIFFFLTDLWTDRLDSDKRYKWCFCRFVLYQFEYWIDFKLNEHIQI